MNYEFPLVAVGLGHKSEPAKEGAVHLDFGKALLGQLRDDLLFNGMSCCGQREAQAQSRSTSHTQEACGHAGSARTHCAGPTFVLMLKG